jgi:two-component system sensor histidine kinase RegB
VLRGGPRLHAFDAYYPAKRPGTQPAPEIVVEQTLRQAIMNLLNNAADASPNRVDVEEHWDERDSV